MDIASYISELLYEHECVVIPGLGGFIVNDRPATINRITHQFSPPFRKIMFNIHLSANDGLLMNYIANSESISYLESKKLVLDFSKRCQDEIKQGNRIDLKGIGTLYKNKEGYIAFDQNSKVNHNADAFGLGSFYSPPIERPTDEERIKGIVEPLLSGKLKPKDRKPKVSRETNVKRRRHAGAIILILFILLLSIGGGYTFKESATNYWQNYAMLIPVFNIDETADQPENLKLNTHKEVPLTSLNKSLNDESSDSDFAPDEIEKKILQAEEKSETEILPAEENTDFVSSETPKEDIQVPDIKPKKRPYLIITGSFSEESNAKKLVSKLKNSGIDALIADTTKSGMYRVAYASFTTIDLAKEKLYALRNEEFPDAWILKKN